MVKNKVFTAHFVKDIPAWHKVLTTTWSMKKKSDGTYRARMVARGFEQVDGEHYDGHDISSPVASEITIRIVFVLMLMAGFEADILDVCGAFLLGTFDPGHSMYIEVPRGFEKFYPPGTVLLLNKTLYGTKQASAQYYKLTQQAFRALEFERNKADSCLQFKWTKSGHLLMWLSWIDDYLNAGTRNDIDESKAGMKKIFECEDLGPMTEYVGLKVEIDREDRSMRLTQPVILQSFEDEFDLPGDKPPNPAPAGSTLKPAADDSELLDPENHSKYRTGVGKLLHVRRMSRPECCNSVRELSKFTSCPTDEHFNAMLRVMEWIVSTREKGWFLKPTGTWDGKDRERLFNIRGKSDSTLATDDNQKSVGSRHVYLEDAPISVGSNTQQLVALSITEAEFIAGIECAQDMLFAMRVIEGLGLKVKKPMVLEMDNKGAVDLANNWSVAGRTRHIATKIAFLRELKEQGILIVRWVSSSEMEADIGTKNVGGSDFERHASKLIR